MLLRTLALLSFFSAGALAQWPFCDQVRSLTADPSVAEAHWGVSVTTLGGTPLCGVNPAQLFRPASNAKLFTSAAALAVFRPDRTFTTRVTGRLDGATGIVTGDLTLVGGGDANLDSGDVPYVPPTQRPKPPAPFTFHDLQDMASQLAAKGVRSVEGDVVGDDRLFTWAPFAQSWSADDLLWGYGAPVSALSIVDNQLRLTITPTAPGQPASVTLEQHGVPYYTLQVEVTTRPPNQLTGVDVQRISGTRILRVFGEIAPGASPEVEEIAVDDPALYTAMAFRNLLTAEGIDVRGTARSEHEYEHSGESLTHRLQDPGDQEQAALRGVLGDSECLPPTVAALSTAGSSNVLASHTSPPLSQDIILTNKVSQNLHAEILLHQLAGRSGCSSANRSGGARMVRAFALQAGLKDSDFLLFDGSGLSDHDLVAPRALTQLLVYAARQPWFASFKAALPIGGVDGSLAARFSGALKGRVFAKTGTLGESRALSGYLTAASGATVVFSVMVDNHLPGSAADRTVMDRIVEVIANGN